MTNPPDTETTVINNEQAATNIPAEVQPSAFKAAAGLLAGNVGLTVLTGFSGQPGSVVSAIIDAVLVFGLLRLNGGARTFTLFRSWAGLILVTIFACVGNDPLTAMLFSSIQLCFSGGVILILHGETKPWKLRTGVGLGVFALGISTLISVFAIATAIL